MTINTRNVIEQAAYEAGRAAAKYEMLIEASGNLHTAAASIAGNFSSERHIVSPQRGREINSPEATLPERMRARHATAKATGVKKATVTRGPRTKGVKPAVVSLIGLTPMTLDGIVAQTGFKKNSVISTLMDLKKKGLAMQDGKAWVGMGYDSGNSEADEGYDSRMETGS